MLDDNSTGSSLPQAYYIAYKNHGQFLLDKVRHKARTRRAEGDTSGRAFEERAVQDDTRRALDEFSAALDRDPSDAELWRRTARVAAFLKSARIGRYCLEAAIELDDDPAVVEVEPPSLAEGFAGEQLRNTLQNLADDMSLSHPSMAPYLKQEMAASLKRYLDPLPWLPNPTKDMVLPKPSTESPRESSPARIAISFPQPSWADLAFALVGSVDTHGISGRAVELDAPAMPDEHQIMQIEIDQQLSGLQREVAEIEGSEDKPLLESKVDDNSPATADDAATARKAEPHDKDDQAAKDNGCKDLGGALSRKRSQSAAGIPEPADDDHADTKRSKRIRRRETQVGEATDPNVAFAEQLQVNQEADQHLFKHTKTLLQKLGVDDSPALDETIAACGQTEGRISKLQNQLAKDLRAALITTYKDDRAKILLSKKDTPVLGLEAFLERTKSGQPHSSEIPAFDAMSGLRPFVVSVNRGWYTVQDVVYKFLGFMARSYGSLKWSEDMKRGVIQVLDSFDAVIYRQIHDAVWPESGDASKSGAPELDAARSFETRSLAQMVFELYVDVYERMNGAGSAAGNAVRMQTRTRLDRWASLVSGLSSASAHEDAGLSYRFLWASVWSTTLAPGVPRDHILACWESLRQSLHEEDAKGNAVDIVLPNSTIMPDVSYKAADREISKLTTMDFFLSLFQEELKDPVVVIDKLEPVLNPDSVYVPIGDASAGEQQPIAACATSELRDMWKFLRGSSTELRMFLWTRLADAYKGIDYSTKVLSCYLRSIEMVVGDLEGEAYLSVPQETSRLQTFMLLLKTIDEMTIQALHIAVNDAHVFEIIDEAHIQSSAAALVRISCMLHVAALHEDEVRIGMASTASSSATFNALQVKLREMQVRTWSLLYTVVKAGLKLAIATGPADAGLAATPYTPGSSPALSPGPSTPTKTEPPGSASRPEGPSAQTLLQMELAEFIGAIHQAVGSRKYCKVSNKIFLRLARSELLKMKSIGNLEDYLGQVLYDLHGIKLGVGVTEVDEHNCPLEKLERKNALALVDKVMSLASGMPMKDLLKSDLKNTIEQMQQAIGQTKSTTQMIHNLRYFTEYLKRPINPMRLYQAWKGTVELDTVPATTPDTVLARNGWFFLLGMVALTKFKGVDLNRRQTPGATDDLRVGAQYLRLQLQLTPSRWDAWFRLAECSDYDLDETVLWSAEKMNKDRADLVKLQRTAIHCYTLALSYYHADPSDLAEADSDTVHDLYHNFALRMYSSSREPFAAECFHHAEYERWLVTPETLETYKKPQHVEMSDYMVWKYAAGLFRRALARRAKDWKSAYMLSKCVWKMYQTPAEQLSPRERTTKPTVDDVVGVLEQSIQVVSSLPKPRHGQDPILEPHYKIATVIHKIVRRGDMHEQAAADILQRQPYAIQRGAAVSVTSRTEWDEFIVKTLKHLRDKDKSNWQHRMIIRQARIHFDDCDLVEETPTAVGSEDKSISKEASVVNKSPLSREVVHGKDGRAADKAVPKMPGPEETTSLNDRANGDTRKATTNGHDRMEVEDDALESITVKNFTETDTAEKLDVDAAADHEKAVAPKTPDAKAADSSEPVAEMTLDGKDTAGQTEPATATDPAKAARVEKAKTAFGVLRESMFTKTMVMNVWKCDAERPGRHHVFTEQYIRFMTRLLVVMDDRVNLEALLRRIRKKGADFYHFSDLWQTCIVNYVRLVRKFYEIPLYADDAFKNVSPEEFEIYAERINAWVGQPDVDHPALSAMREAVEIKKLNSNLMKAGPIDDLISNCYSVIFAEVARDLPGERPAKIIEERHQQQREEADKAAKAEKAERAEKEKKSETTAAIMLSFNLLSDRTGAADKDSANGYSRAGSETPGGGGLLSAEKMERSGSGMGGDQPHRRARVYNAVRRPDILRKAEQATARVGDLLAKSGAAGSNANDGQGSVAGGSAGVANGMLSRRVGDGPVNGTGVSRRSTRLGSSSSARHDINNSSLEALGGRAGSVHSKDGDGSGADGDGSGSGARGLLRRTRSKSRHLSVDHSRAEGEGGEDEDEEEEGEGDTEMHDATDGAKAKSAARLSPHASIDDLADDDSELSDVPADYEENAPLSMLFPNLRRSQDEAGKSGESDGDDEADDEEEDEEDEEEDGASEQAEAEEGDDGGDEEEEDEDDTVELVEAGEVEEVEEVEEVDEADESEDGPAEGDTVTVAVGGESEEEDEEDEEGEEEEDGEEGEEGGEEVDEEVDEGDGAEAESGEEEGEEDGGEEEDTEDEEDEDEGEDEDAEDEEDETEIEGDEEDVEMEDQPDA